jgi:hypothetical protein
MTKNSLLNKNHLNSNIMKNYDVFLEYFQKRPFGSEMPVLSILSTLPPEDRCRIIERVLELDITNVEAYNKLSMAYIKNNQKNKAFELLKNANKNGNLSNSSYQVLNNKLIELDNNYRGNYGSALGYEQTIEILETKVSSDIKSSHSIFYNIVYNFSKKNLENNSKGFFSKLFGK